MQKLVLLNFHKVTKKLIRSFKDFELKSDKIILIKYFPNKKT